MKRLIFILVAFVLTVGLYAQSEDALPMKTNTLLTDTFRIVKDGESALMQKGTFMDGYARTDGIDTLNFNSPVTPQAPAEGTMWWNSDDWTLNLSTGQGPVIQVGQEFLTVVYNGSGSFINNGTPVRPIGAANQGRPIVGPANCLTHEGFAGKVLVTTMDIPNGEFGLASSDGKVRGVNTSLWSKGDILYVNSVSTNNWLTNVKPEFPLYAVQIGGVDSVHTTSGSIQLAIRADAEATVNNFWNGVFRETFDFLISSNGTVVTGALAPSNGNPNMTMMFSDGLSMLTTSPSADITLTPGTDSNPQTNYVYVLQSTKALASNISSWPSEEHIKVAEIVLRSAATTQNEGALRNQNWNDHIQGTNGQGHLSHITEKLRSFEAQHDFGTEGSISIAIGPPDDVWVSTTSGYVKQMHSQYFPPFDTQTGDDIHIVNHPTTAYLTVSNLSGQQLDSDGVSLNNTSFSFVLWGVVNKTGEPSHLMLNLPSGSYAFVSPDNAVQDAFNYSNYTIPDQFSGVGFLIARFTLTQKNGSWVLYDTEDLRGRIPNTAAGGGSGGTGATTFLGLTDTPSSYTGSENLYPRVNATGTGIEFDAGGGTPAGSEGEIQFNSSSSFGASSELKWFDSEGALRIGNSFTDPSAAPMLSLNKTRTLSGVNGHGFVDINNITMSSGYAYAAFDARSTISGTNNYDHYNGFQSAPTYSASGTITKVSGMSTILTVTSGTVANNAGYKLAGPVVSGGGSVTNFYGVWLDGTATTATNNWFLYNDGTTRSYLGGNLGIKNSSPSYELDVTGSVNVTGGFFVNGTPIGAGSSLWSTSGSNIYYNTGNVGVGVSSPAIDFHVRRNITAATGGQYYSMFLEASSSTNMVDEFGPTLDFGIRDDAATSNRIVRIGGYRSGDDISGTFFVGTSNLADGGVGAPKFTVNNEGWAGFGTGYSTPLGAVEVSSTDGAFIPPRMTTAQRTALAAVNGSMVYDTSIGAMFTYENGAWKQQASGTPVNGGDIIVLKSDWRSFTFGLGNANATDTLSMVVGSSMGEFEATPDTVVPERIRIFCEGASGDATVQLYHGTDPTAAGTAILTTAYNISTIDGLESTTTGFAVTSIPKDNFIWAEITSVSEGTKPTKIRLYFAYSYD